MRELLFRVTKQDFIETHIRGSGNGGQARNKVHSGVRLVHKDSGAVGESTSSRSQGDNRVLAFQRLRETKEWTSWFRTKMAVSIGMRPIEEVVKEMMDPKNLRTQIRENDKWVDTDELQG